MPESQHVNFDIIIDRFYGGMVRDDKSPIAGSSFNLEEIDIWTNANYFQAEQIVSADTMPASTSIYARTIGDDDTAYGYGKETSGNKVRLVSVASGGATNPGSFTTLFTSADATNLATTMSHLTFFRTTEGSNPTSLYYIQGASSSWYIGRYNIGAAAEQTWNGSTWTAGTANASSQLTGLNGSWMRPAQRVIFGDLYICHGRYVAKVAKDSTFTEKAFTLPSEWEAVDIIPAGDAAIILCRNKAVNTNEVRGYWWNLTSQATFEDMFSIPMGGPQWILNIKEAVMIFCAINGVGKFFRLSVAAKGAVPIEIPGVTLLNMGVETSTQPISSPKMVSAKDKIVYFGMFKTDKTGIFSIGQLDADKPYAVCLSKRYGTTDYSLHKPYSLIIQGPNFYGDFLDNATDKSVRCSTNNSPNRSTQAVYESLWADNKEPLKNKQFGEAYVATYPLSASTTVALSVAVDYSSSYTALKRNDGTDFNTTNGMLARMTAGVGPNKKVFRLKCALTSSGANSPKVVAMGIRGQQKTEMAGI